MDNIRIEAERVGVPKTILSTMRTQGWDVEKTMAVIGIDEAERPLGYVVPVSASRRTL